MGSIIAFLAGVIFGAIILGLVSVGSQKEREYMAYKRGLEEGKNGRHRIIPNDIKDVSHG